MISELVQGHYIFPRGTLKVKFEFNLDPWFTKLVQGQWILSNLLHPKWVNRGVKLQTQIFIRSCFFLHLDLWSRKLIQSHCTPSTYGHFINKDWVWLSHKGKEIYAPKKWNLCKLWSKFTMKPAYHCQFCFCCIGCGAPDKSFGLYLFHTLSTGAQICWNFVNWLVHVYWNRHWLAKILNLHARIETFLSLIQHVN